MHAAELLILLTMAADEPVRVVHSQKAWVISSDQVELAVTQLGGHMAPVSFFRRDAKPVQPYHITPWQDEKLKVENPVLVPLRGDFFCLPFGGGREPGGREHPPHGETATATWSFGSVTKKDKLTTFTAKLTTRVRAGQVTKRLMLVDGENAVYSEHTVEGFDGPATPGHHATLRLPDKEGSFRVSSSAFEFGTTSPTLFSNPADREYQALAIGAEFRDLTQVPLRFKDARENADLTRFPARRGYADLLAIYKKASADPAWMAALNQEEHYVWFSLKDAGILPATVFWVENGGRHASPWSGRNRCLGLEDVRWFFEQSHVPNAANKRGIPTSMKFGGAPVIIRYIQGAAKVPAGMEAVRTVEFSPGAITLVGTKGERIRVPVRHEFLRNGF